MAVGKGKVLHQKDTRKVSFLFTFAVISLLSESNFTSVIPKLYMFVELLCYILFLGPALLYQKLGSVVTMAFHLSLWKCRMMSLRQYFRTQVW